MIQELLGGNNGGMIKGDQKPKLSNNPSCGGINILDGTLSSSSSAAAASAAAEKLRCPRCESPNTKFCYYNNYNLTQPRHFCKACRRYWTKGGALRNVPIGGGCRKNKTTAIAAAVGKSAGKSKTASSSEFVKTGLMFSGFEHGDHHHHQALSANPNIVWASYQNNFHFLSLLRGSNQNPNYPDNSNNNNNNHLPNSISHVKEEVNNNNNNNFLFGSSISRVTGLDPFGPAHAQSSAGFVHGEVQNNGLQELFQRLRSPPQSTTSSYYPAENPAPALILGNMASANSSTASSAILESAPVGTGDQLGFWNHTLSWPADLSTTNGAYP